MGMRVSRHLPACITELKSMFNARRSCAAPTRAECPEILSHSCLSKPIHFPTFRNTADTFCAVNDSPTPAEPRTLTNTGPDFKCDPSNQTDINRMVNGDKYAVAPVVSVFERRMRTLPDPSPVSAMSSIV